MAFRYKSKREQDKALDRSDPSDEDDNKKPVQGPSSDSDVQRPRRSNIRVQRIAKYQEPVVEPIIGAELKTKTPVGKAKGYVNPTSTLKKEAACFDDRAATSLALAKYDEEFAEYLRDPLNFDRRSPGSAKKPSSSKVQPRKSRKSSSSTSEAVDVSSSQRKTAGKSGRASRSSSDSTESRRPKKSHRLRQETLIGKSAKKRKEKATRVRSKSSSHDSSASIKSRRRKKSHGLKQLTLIGKPSEPRKQKKAKDINNLASVVKPARQGRSRIRSKLSQHGLRHRRSKSNASSTTSKKLATRKKHGKPSMYSNYKKMLEMQSKSRKIESKADGGFGRSCFGPSPSGKRSTRSQSKLSTTGSSLEEVRSSRSSSRKPLSQSKSKDAGGFGRKTFGPSPARRSSRARSRSSTTGSDRQPQPSVSKQAKTLVAQCEKFALYGGSGPYEKKKTLNLVVKSGGSSYVATILIKIKSDKPNTDFKIGEYSLKP